MSAKLLRIVIAVVMMTVLLTAAGQAISASVVMKVSRTANDSVVNEGEDLNIDVVLDGISPASYRWYCNDEAIPGAVYRSFSLVSAKPEDAGSYRVDAFDENGKMLVSMEFAVRVIAKELPKSGDGTLDIGAVAAVMGVLGAVMTGAVVRKKKTAA